MMEMLAFPSIRTVSEKLALVLTHTTKPEKEVELNQLQYQIIKNDLSNLGFLVKTSIDQNDFCMFGKSLKDHGGNIVKAGLLKKICSNEFEELGDEEICTVGGVVEFKIGSDVKKFYPQMFADMVRLGCYLTYNALVRGNIIDSIQIFGLLVVHGTNSGILMKYYVDFQQDQSMLFLEDETNAKLGFISIDDLLQNV